MMQNFKSKLFGSIVTGAFLMAASGTDASHSSGRIIIAQQGSFFVGDATIRAPGEFDPTDPNATDAGRLFPIDQMYVQYQIPPHPRKYPLVLIHGGGLTGKSWETTADGREGYQTIFLRRGFSVYIVDFPRRGRAGFPSFNGRLGALLDQQVIPDQTGRSSEEVMFMQFRLGPKFLEFFPNSQFPKAGLDQYFQQGIPFVSDDTDVVTGAIVALLDRIGPAILVGHSQSSLFACLAAIRSPNVVGIVEYEGAFASISGWRATGSDSRLRRKAVWWRTGDCTGGLREADSSSDQPCRRRQFSFSPRSQSPAGHSAHPLVFPRAVRYSHATAPRR